MLRHDYLVQNLKIPFFCLFHHPQTDSDQSSEKFQEFIDIDLASSEKQSFKASLMATARRLSPSYIDIAQALIGTKRDTLLKIVESDDDESWDVIIIFLHVHRWLIVMTKKTGSISTSFSYYHLSSFYKKYLRVASSVAFSPVICWRICSR